MKNNKGFTLIELLAVIVVLAIVLVLAVTTVLPYVENTKKDAFLVEVDSSIEAAKAALGFLEMGEYPENGRVNFGVMENGSHVGYCFTISELIEDFGLLENSDDSYKGSVLIKEDGDTYKYYVSLTNGSYYIYGTSFSLDNIGESKAEANAKSNVSGDGNFSEICYNASASINKPTGDKPTPTIDPEEEEE